LAPINARLAEHHEKLNVYGVRLNTLEENDRTTTKRLDFMCLQLEGTKTEIVTMVREGFTQLSAQVKALELEQVKDEAVKETNKKWVDLGLRIIQATPVLMIILGALILAFKK